MMLIRNYCVIFATFLCFHYGNTQSPPVFECKRVGDVCTFESVVLNSTHYNWTPTTDNAILVGTVKFVTSVVPVITKNICATFPAMNRLELNSLRITKIEEDAFFGCTLLTFLYLNDNSIKALSPTTFSYVVQLMELHLHNNFIEELNDSKIFANLPRLTTLTVSNNNLTEFSPTLLRQNYKLETFWIHSNYLRDLDIEQLLKLTPDLKLLYWDDNEASCTRTVAINKILEAKGIIFNAASNVKKVRYYPVQLVFGGLTCVPDISWMAADYRKENSELRHEVVDVRREMYRYEEKIDEMEEMLKKVIK